MQIPLGRYLHYKGKEYEVLGTATHSETLDSLVVYKALYNSKDHGENALWVRPTKMFTETVTIDGQQIPRFKLIS